ncbi:hypothetical protein [Micromonospora sp. NPDC050495]|uniref:hypothetical protein n=1 Tax=Micromonospora sp. NPDC050495 TaxID=3154936 RepID=UPI0033E86F87
MYRERRDALIAAVRRHLPAARVSGIAAGLHLVLELPAGVDDAAVARAARSAGLGPGALADLRVDRPGPPGLVLGYPPWSRDELAGAVGTLAELIGP